MIPADPLMFLVACGIVLSIVVIILFVSATIDDVKKARGRNGEAADAEAGEEEPDVTE